ERLVHLRKALRQLRKVVRDRQDEELLLGGEVPVDQGLVDPDRTGDLLHRGILHATLVEERTRRLDDFTLALAPGVRACGPTAATLAIAIAVPRSHESIITETPAASRKFSPEG